MISVLKKTQGGSVVWTRWTLCVFTVSVVRDEETLFQRRRDGILQEGQEEGRPQEPHDRCVCVCVCEKQSLSKCWALTVLSQLNAGYYPWSSAPWPWRAAPPSVQNSSCFTVSCWTLEINSGLISSECFELISVQLHSSPAAACDSWSWVSVSSSPSRWNPLSRVTENRVTENRVTENRVTENRVSVSSSPSRWNPLSRVTENRVTESQRTESQRTESQSVPLSADGTHSAESQRTESQRTESQSVPLSADGTHSAESQRTESQRTESQRTESQRTESQRTESQSHRVTVSSSHSRWNPLSRVTESQRTESQGEEEETFSCSHSHIRLTLTKLLV